MLSTEHARTVLEARAIAPEVYTWSDDRERYVSVSTYAELREAHTHPKPFHSRLINESSALIVNRWGLSGEPLPSYLRFDAKVHPDPRKKGKRYIYAAKIDAPEVKVIDVHPLAAPSLLNDPAEVFFCIEGSLKADALLSLPGTATKAVLSVPSVTLWGLSPKTFAPYRRIMRKAEVVWVLPDCDYLTEAHSIRDGRPIFLNDQVRLQTDKAVKWLRDQGINARFMVPPYLRFDDAKRYGIEDDRKKIGVDDLLAIGGNLEQWNLDSNPLGVHRFSYNAYKGSLPLLTRKRRDRAAERDSAFLRWLTERYGPEGLFRPGDAAHDLGWSQSTTYRAYMGLIERGALTVWQGKTNVDGFSDPHLFVFRLDPEAGGIVRYEALADLRHLSS